MNNQKQQDAPVLKQVKKGVMTITLNRPKALNSLTTEMIRLIQSAMDEAASDAAVKVVLFEGAGDRSFCAGADIKILAKAVRENRPDQAMTFYREEYELDLNVYDFPKPVVLMAKGITMGGGLGLAAGADLVIADETTRMAMPETRIGFFPDVGATGWMFAKCPEGYPEFLGLTGHELVGPECVRVGLATHFIFSGQTMAAKERIHQHAKALLPEKEKAVSKIEDFLKPLFENGNPSEPDLDDWVSRFFAGKNAALELVDFLKQHSQPGNQFDSTLKMLEERSPTSMVLTLKLLRHNASRPIKEVFQADLAALEFILKHPDYVEGVRARLLDKDNAPKWQPARLEEVGEINLNL